MNVRIIYSTTSGNTELVVRMLEDALRVTSYEWRTDRAEELEELPVTSYQLPDSNTKCQIPNTKWTWNNLEPGIRNLELDWDGDNKVAGDYPLVTAPCLVFACGTYGHWVLQGHMRALLEKRAKDVDLTWVRCAVIWLGDDKYDKEYNVEAANILEKFITDRWGELCVPSLRINKDPVSQLEGKIQTWCEEFVKQLPVTSYQ